jgi:hypothetical protein
VRWCAKGASVALPHAPGSPFHSSRPSKLSPRFSPLASVRIPRLNSNTPSCRISFPPSPRYLTGTQMGGSMAAMLDVPSESFSSGSCQQSADTGSGSGAPSGATSDWRGSTPEGIPRAGGEGGLRVSSGGAARGALQGGGVERAEVDLSYTSTVASPIPLSLPPSSRPPATSSGSHLCVEYTSAAASPLPP